MRFLAICIFGLFGLGGAAYAQDNVVNAESGNSKYVTVATCYGSGGIQLAFQSVFGSVFEQVVVQTPGRTESFLIALGSAYDLRGLLVAAAPGSHASLRIDFAEDTYLGIMTLSPDRQLNKSVQYKVVCSDVNP